MTRVRWWQSIAALVGLAVLLLPAAAALRAAEAQPQLTGDTRIHDPSVIEVDGRFVAVGTGQQGPTHGAIRAKTSPYGIAWTDAGVIGKGPPEWAAAVIGFKALNVWAPWISRCGGTFFLYYCLSGFGDNASAPGS
jgi:arabinan endo-1,5-alpha-L-arabinosidase